MICDLKLLSHGQREAINTLALLKGTGETLDKIQDPEELAMIFRMWSDPNGNCVPEGEAGENTLNDVHTKFYWPLQTAVMLAEQKIAPKEKYPNLFDVVVDPSYEDATWSYIVGSRKDIVYYRDQTKAWYYHFASLGDLADHIVKIAQELVYDWERKKLV